MPRRGRDRASERVPSCAEAGADGAQVIRACDSLGERETGSMVGGVGQPVPGGLAGMEGGGGPFWGGPGPRVRSLRDCV